MSLYEFNPYDVNLVNFTRYLGTKGACCIPMGDLD